MTVPLEIAVFNMQVLPQNMGKCVIGAFFFKNPSSELALNILLLFILRSPIPLLRLICCFASPSNHLLYSLQIDNPLNELC